MAPHHWFVQPVVGLYISFGVGYCFIHAKGNAKTESKDKAISSHTFFFYLLSSGNWSAQNDFLMKIFSKDEIVAIYKAAYSMVLVDEKVMVEEMEVVNHAMVKLGITNLAELEDIKNKALVMNTDECYGQLAFLETEQKKFVSAMLGAICSSDGDIDDRELELWRNFCFNCDLPKMNNRQAISIFQSY